MQHAMLNIGTAPVCMYVASSVSVTCYVHMFCEAVCAHCNEGRNAMQVDVFLHTYQLQQLDSVWSDERNVRLNTTEWQLLAPKATSFTSQDAFLDSVQYVSLL